MEASTIIGNFYKWEKQSANKPFLRQPFGDKWETYTWGEVGQTARKLATGLKSLGLPDKAHIGLVSKNCREWIIADLAIMMAGYVSVPFFPTLTSDQINEVLRLGDVNALFVGKMEVWEEMQKGVPEDMPVIAFPHYEGNSKVTRGHQWEEFINKFEPMQGTPEPGWDDMWTIVFTSGTTGTPKGVVLENNINGATKKLMEEGNNLKISLSGDNRFFSFLPLNHIAERVIVESTCINYGGTISFTESLAKFAQNLSDTQPTIFFAVPRIWTKLQMGVLSKMPQSRLNTLLKIPIVKGVIKNKIKSGLGLDQARVVVSGAAPMTQEQKDWFHSLGFPLAEGYGMTENCAIATFLMADEKKPGSVGKAQPGSVIKIDPDTQEILFKAPWNMVGYYNSPEKSAETLKDGWLHTGDQGRLDNEGYLYITGRVKDTFKTAKGKFIVPAKIEKHFETNTDLEQVCVVGLGCQQPLILVYPSEIGLGKSQSDLKASLENTLKTVNTELPNYQKVSNIIVTKEPWTVESQLLTPTLKVKRPKINDRFKKDYVAWQESGNAVIFEA